MSENTTITADTLELLLLNQISMRAAIEELSVWVSHRGSANVHENVMTTLETMDRNNEAIISSIHLLKN
nr:hypothetical protein [uncultured Pseudomonas sp.]